jgi:glutathione transport system substrate-binding protein
LAIHEAPLDRRSVCLSIASSALLTAGCARSGAKAPPRSDALTIMQTEGPRSMDPADHTATLTGAILDPMYEGLVRQASQGGVEPLLATGWTSSADALTWTFQLREAVGFHDGSEMDADAAARSFRRLIDPASTLAAAGKFTPVVASCEAVGPRTVRFRLRKPYADFLTLLACNQAAVVSPRAAASGVIGRAACGTGPFRFVAWRSDEDVQQRRNDGYWGQQPRLESLRWRWSSEPSVLYMALRTGDADIAAPLSPVFARAAAGAASLRLIRQSATTFFWIALNTLLPPFDDPRVRQALSYATDRSALVAGLLGGFGRPASAPLADATPFVDPDPARLRFDPALGRRLLAEAGHATGLRIAIAVQDDDELLAEALQAMWRSVGVELQIRRLEGGVYASAAFARPPVKAAEGLGGVLSSWSSGVVPDLQLRPLFDSASAAPIGANLGFFSDPAVDALIDAGAAATDPRARAAFYAAVQRRIVEEAPAVLLYTRDDLAGVRRGVSGVSFRPGGELIVSAAGKQRGPG